MIRTRTRKREIMPIENINEVLKKRSEEINFLNRGRKYGTIIVKYKAIETAEKYPR